MMTPVKTTDLELWKKWKASRSPSDLQNLLDQLNPIIMREVLKWAPSISRSFLEMEGKRLAVEAFDLFNPAAGAALSTYLTSRLQKLSRVVYSTQNTARLSETKNLLYQNYAASLNTLKDLHGREPSSDELADHLGWSLKRLAKFQREAHRKEFVESEDHPESEHEEDHLTDYIYHDLTPLQKSIFEYRTGYLGMPRLSGNQITNKLNITQGQLSHQLTLIEKAILKAQGKL